MTAAAVGVAGVEAAAAAKLAATPTSSMPPAAVPRTTYDDDDDDDGCARPWLDGCTAAGGSGSRGQRRPPRYHC